MSGEQTLFTQRVGGRNSFSVFRIGWGKEGRVFSLWL